MKVYFDTIGCRLNQSEIERYANQFRSAGHIVVDNPSEADLVVVNTCAVTAEAASDSRQKIRQAARAGAKEIVATGCWVTMEPHSAAALPNVTRVQPNIGKDHLVQEILREDIQGYDLEPISRKPLPGAHRRTRAFIKTQDGCDNHCTFCVTRILRGPGRSLPVEEILGDIRQALSGGTKEVVLTGVHLGSWGQDFEKALHLKNLIEIILAETDVPRLHLSSLEPWDLNESFFTLWNNSRMCRHLHLPLQSGSTATLRRMARKTTPDSFAKLVEHARQISPEIAITTDIIVGFPGETDEEFAQTLSFVEGIRFAGGHVFHYSARPGTPAAKFSNQIPLQVCKERSAALRSVLADSAIEYRLQFTGMTTSVLWESAKQTSDTQWKMEGLTDNYLRVIAKSFYNRWNTIDRVFLNGLVEEGIDGEILDGE